MRKYVEGFFMALGMFTTFPCPYRPWNEDARRFMLICFPLVGLVIGIVWYAVFIALTYVPWLLQLEAAVLLFVPYAATGFIHLDGFMDTCDAILSRRPLEEKLRILKEPHAGAFSVICFGVVLLMTFASLWGTMETLQDLGHLSNPFSDWPQDPLMLVLVIIPIISRCCSALYILQGKPLGHSQYYKKVQSSSRWKEALGVLAVSLCSILIVLGAGAALIGFTPHIFVVMAVCVFAYLFFMRGAVREMGGVSGDLAGYSLTLAETAGLVALSVVILW